MFWERLGAFSRLGRPGSIIPYGIVRIHVYNWLFTQICLYIYVYMIRSLSVSSYIYLFVVYV